MGSELDGIFQFQRKNVVIATPCLAMHVGEVKRSKFGNYCPEFESRPALIYDVAADLVIIAIIGSLSNWFVNFFMLFARRSML